MTRFKIALLGSAALVSAVAAFGLQQRHGVSAAPAPSRTAQGCEFSVGEQLAFNVHSTGTAGNPGEAGAAPQSIRLDAVMWWRVLEERGGSWVLGAALDGVKLSEGAAPPDGVRSAALQAPFSIQIGKDCRFRTIRFGTDSDPEARHQITGLLRSIELIRSPRPGAEWVSRHQDELGPFDATYRLDTSSKTPMLSRTRSRYTSAMGTLANKQLGGRPRVEILQSQIQAALDPQGRWARELTDQEHLRFFIGNRLLSEVTAAVDLTRIETTGSPPSALDRLRPDMLLGSEGEPVAAKNEPPPPPPPDPALAVLDVNGAVADFQRTLSTVNDGLFQATQRLAGYLAANPTAIDELVAKIRSGAIDPKLHSALFLALQKTRSAAAEKALGTALADRGMSPLNRMRAASALSDIPKPSLQTARTLIDQSRQPASNVEEREVSGAALLALGALSHRVLASQPAVVEAVRGDLTERLRSASASTERNLALDAIGNAGDKALADAVREYGKDADPGVRAHAAQAFRRMELGTSEPVLADWLSREEEPQVRRSIASALNEKLHDDQRAPSPATVQAAVARLAKESDAPSRAVLIELLGRAAATEPAAKQALIEQFRREKLVELQVLIGRYVGAADLQ